MAQAQHHAEASLTRTTYGVLHVKAANWRGIGYGYGYGVAEDNLCVLADALVTFRGQRSRYFGPDLRRPAGTLLGSPTNLSSDIFFRSVIPDAEVARYRAAQPADLRALVDGYAAGLSRYIREIQAGKHSGRHLSCRAANWLGPVSRDDIFRRMIALAMSTSSDRFIDQIGSAQPPGIGSVSAVAGLSARGLPDKLDYGSNALAFGSEGTGSANGLLLGNPHWFWSNADRFHQVHFTIPGKLDVAGAAILGVPLVMIGYNRNVAWTHTVSTAQRYTLYQLQLVPGDPTAYVYDGKVLRMSSQTVTVPVRRADGSVGEISRTVYRSRFGPMLSTGWTHDHAISIRDVNAENRRPYITWMRWATARNLKDFIRIERQETAMPWVNTIAVGRDADSAWYSDIGAVPNLSDATLAACQVADAMLDGSRSACEWGSDPDSRQPGTFGPSKLPGLLRRDYVANMNDSFWLANPAQPLTGFPRIIGSTNTEQSLRTRMGHRLVADRFAGRDGLPGNRMTSEALRTTSLNGRVLSAELFLGDMLGGPCKSTELTATDGKIVDIAAACAALAGWDRRGGVRSRGGQVWDRFWAELDNRPAIDRYRIPFDASHPMETPRGLRVDDPTLRTAFADAVQALAASGVPASAERGSYQFLLTPGGEPIPLEGGCGPTGYFAVVCTTFGPEGASVREHGNSYMQVVGFDDRGPVAFTLMLPSQSTDPASPYFRDYTRAYSKQSWLQTPFYLDDIKLNSDNMEIISQ